MTIIDFFIGFFLMNAMPHFVLGTWRQRMLSAFGFSNKANLAYGLLCYVISLGLFLFAHGFEGLMSNGIYAGASTILIIYFLTSHFWRDKFSISEENEFAEQS